MTRTVVRSERPKLAWLPGALLILAVFLAYQQVWHAGFIWDDPEHVTENPWVVGSRSFWEIWTTPAARICPLVISSFRLEYAFWGEHALPFHLVNVALHIGSALVLWRALLLLEVRGAFFGAALWALHPVQVESVAWITELKNTQSCFFYLLCILFFLRWLRATPTTDSRRALNYSCALLFGAFAIASKSSTVVLPVVLGLCAWWIERGVKRRSILGTLPFFLLAAAGSALSVWTQSLEGANDPRWAFSLAHRLALPGKVVWFYLGKLFWPHPLIFIYPRWEIDGSKIISFVPTILLIATFFFLWWKRNRGLRPVLFALAYFVVAVFPVLGLLRHFFLRYSFVGDHFQYLASMGPLALAGAVTATYFDHWTRRVPYLPRVCYAAVLVSLGVLAWGHSATFVNNETLWRRTLSLNPNAWMAENNLGSALLHQGKLDEAIVHFENSLRIYPNNASARGNIGIVRFQKGQVDEAIADFNAALAISPDEPNAHFHLANALASKGQLADAIPHYQAALVTKGVPEYHQNFALALFRLGRVSDAISEYRIALRLKPDYTEAYFNLATALEQQGALPEAVASYERVIQRDPEHVAAHNNLAWLLATSPTATIRNGARAVELATTATRLTNEQDFSILDTMAAAYAESGRFAEAVETAETAFRLAGKESDPALQEGIRNRLEMYRARQAFRSEPASVIPK